MCVFLTFLFVQSFNTTATSTRRGYSRPSNNLKWMEARLVKLLIRARVVRGGDKLVIQGRPALSDQAKLWSESRASENSVLCPTGHRPFGAAAQKRQITHLGITFR